MDSWTALSFWGFISFLFDINSLAPLGFKYFLDLIILGETVLRMKGAVKGCSQESNKRKARKEERKNGESLKRRKRKKRGKNG
jgi:hypothetical protein